MLFDSGQEFIAAAQRSVVLMGMSGVGKTRLASLLRAQGGWYHYSVDYRIGTRYLGEPIADSFKREAMRSSFFRELLLSDSVKIRANIRFDHLMPLTTYLGKPGDSKKGGLTFAEYVRRQRQHRQAEIAAMTDAIDFCARARELYGYAHFLCDASGSLVEIVETAVENDKLMNKLAPHFLFLYIEGDDRYEEALRERFAIDPKPMYYNEEFLRDSWDRYLKDKKIAQDQVDPDEFARWGFAELIRHRLPRYHALAERWGYHVKLSEAEKVTSVDGFLQMVAGAIERRQGRI